MAIFAGGWLAWVGRGRYSASGHARRRRPAKGLATSLVVICATGELQAGLLLSPVYPAMTISPPSNAAVTHDRTDLDTRTDLRTGAGSGLFVAMASGDLPDPGLSASAGPGAPDVIATASAPCVGLLLAAGEGRRFAERAPGQHKLLATLPDGQSVAVAAAMHLRAAVPRVVAVVRPEARRLADLLREAGCEVLEAPEAHEGMGASLAAGARYLLHTSPVPRACLVALADMPWIAPLTLTRLAEQAWACPISVPRWQGRRGHPVVFRADLYPELAQLSGDVGGRTLMTRHPVNEIDVADPGVLRDVDVPDDLTRPYSG